MRSRSFLPSGPHLVLGAALGVVLCACAGKRAADATAPDAPKVALEEAAKAAEANDLRKYVDTMDPIAHLDDEANSRALVMEPPPNTGAVSSIAVVPNPALAAPLPPARARADLPAADAPAVPDESPESRLGRLVGELRQTIRELRAGGDNASAEAIELLGLDLLQPDSVEPELRAVEARLPAGQQRTLDTLRQLLVDLRAGGGSAVGLDARRVSGLLSAHADRLAEHRAIRIIGSALCTSVESFGRYTRFPSYTFLQGRAQPLIIYVAVENFSQRPATPVPAPDAPAGSEALSITTKGARTARADAAPPESPDEGDWVVELSETVAIHNAADDLVVWRAPDAAIRDPSRDRRRDYYLVQRVELPARLTLGKYTLKISVRDGANGATDEAIIPIEVVADAALVKRR